MHRRAAVLLAASLAAAPSVSAREEKAPGTTYHFGVAENKTNVQFESETSVETILGKTHRMTGTAVLDFEKGDGSAELKVPVKSLDTGLEARNEHLRSDGWLDAEKFPEIVFRSKSLKRVKSDEETKKETWAYEGDLTIHGVTKALKGEASVQRVPENLGRNLGPGSWVKVKASFQVTLRDFDISVPEFSAAKVSPTWDVKVDIFGTTKPPEEKHAPKAE